MTESEIRQGRIMVVDDQEDCVALVEQMLQKAGYKNVLGTVDSRQTLKLSEVFQPDLLILDLHMPPPDGYQVLDSLTMRSNGKHSFPVLVLTADMTPAAKVKALALGAKDFLTKPVEYVELLLRVRNLLETQLLYRQVSLVQA